MQLLVEKIMGRLAISEIVLFMNHQTSREQQEELWMSSDGEYL